MALGAVLSLLGCAEERANPLNAPVGVGGEPTDGRVGAGGEAGGVGERPGPGARGDGAGGGPGSPEGGVPYAEGGDEPYVDPGDGRPDICPDGSARSLDGECSDLHLPDPIRVESVLPASGPVQGGTLVTIVGAGFIRPTEVFVAGQPISVDPVRHEGELRFPTPDVSDLGILGPVDIEIRNEAGNFTLAGGFNYFDQVRLDSLSVDHGTTAGGDSIRIHGGGFDDSLVVAFGRRTAADVRVLSAEQAQVISPPGPAGAVDVRAFTDSGQALLADAFTYVTPVRLDTVLPRSGPLEGGTVVTLSGDGFTPDATVYVGNRQAAVLGVSEDRRTLTASTPRVDDPGARNVRVVSAGGEARLIGAFSYVDPDDPALVVHSVVPPAGSTSGGDPVFVVGANFGDDALVAFGDHPADCDRVDRSTLTCLTPEADGPGAVDVLVEGRRARAVLEQGFEYRRPLQVTHISPSAGPVAGGTRITVRGIGFDADTTLQIGVSEALRVQALDGDTVVAITPPGAAGPADVIVRRGDGVRTSLPGGFQYTDSLRLLSVLPGEGARAGGTRVTLLGTGFVPGSRLTFGGAAATDVRVANGASLTARTPPGAAGPVDVTLVTPAGAQAVLQEGFSYFNPATRYGGTWGGPAEGSVNLTAYDGATGQPKQDAVCLLGTDRGGDYEGPVDERGQITFSGDDVFGEQQMTCCAPGYSCGSIVAYDAENASVYLFPLVLPPSEGEGEGEPDAIIAGEVWGIDKYLKPLANEDEGWVAVAYVQTTTSTMYFDDRPDPGPGWMVFDDGPFEIESRPGDVAIVAMGGLLHRPTGEFRPLRIGAARWLFAIWGERIDDVGINLNILLDDVAGLRFDDPPLDIDRAPNWMVTEPSILFDADGAYPLWQYVNVTGEPIEHGLDLHLMPPLINALQGASFTFRTQYGQCEGCRADPRSVGLPYTETYTRAVVSLDEEIEVTPILGITNLTPEGPRGFSQLDPANLRDDRYAWAVDGGSDLPSAQRHIFFHFRDGGTPEMFWEIFLQGDVTEARLPDTREFHAVGAGEPELVALLAYNIYDHAFEIDAFEYGDFGLPSLQARSLSVSWFRY